MSAKILVIGSNGQLGKALLSVIGDEAIAVARPDIDLLDKNFTAKLDDLVAGQPLKAVINAAAYTQVDKAEGDGKAEAFRINGEAVAELASWCAARNLPLVHFSTDYVYDGGGNSQRSEAAIPKPLNAYGASKLMGDEAVAQCGGRYLVLRTSWIYDAQGKNFFTTVLRLIGEKKELSVVDDQTGAPTYALHLAYATVGALNLALAAKIFPSGLYHLCASGQTSWCGFAQAILALARSRDSSQEFTIACQDIYPIPTRDYPLPAKRPLNSRLDCSKAQRLLGITLPPWNDALRECFEEKYGCEKRHTTGSKNHSVEADGG